MAEMSKNALALLKIYVYDEAQKSGAKLIEPEHLLLVMIKNKFTTAYKILEGLNINLLNLQVKLEQFLYVDDPIQSEKLPYSNRLQLVISRAFSEARLRQSSIIYTEYLLLALASEENSVFNKFLILENKTVQDVKDIIDPIDQKREKTTMKTVEKKQNLMLLEFGIDLTEKYKLGLLDPVIGRTKETDRIIQILSRRNKNNPILVGEPGVGKTAIIEGLTARIVEENVPKNLLNKKIISLEMGNIIAGTKYRGQFEERIKKLVQEVSTDKNIIIFIDEIHTLVGGGMGQNSLDAADLLKPALARGEIQCIGATTPGEYRKSIEKDTALERRFQPIQIHEPDKIETINIIKGIKSKYEFHHNVEYSEEAIELSVDLSERYITNRFFPDKVIDVIDEAGAMKKIEIDKRPDELSEIENKIQDFTVEKEECVKNQDYENAGVLRDKVNDLKKDLELIKIKWLNNDYHPLGIVDKTDIIKTISVITDIPLQELNEDESIKMLNMEKIINTEVIGQSYAVSILANAIRRSRAGISSPDRPIGSFLFLGPTGVGKTLLAKKLSKFLFGKENSLIRIDMSDFMEKHNVARLTGAPPGYIGFENGGLLTEKIRRNPYSVILFDEIEKAHPDFFNMLLQILEEGELQDNLGHTVNFRNTVIIMTSNAGSRTIINESRLGFNVHDAGVMDYEEIKLNAESEIKNFLSPEFINRIDDIIVFTPLEKESIKKILTLEVEKLKTRMAEKKIILQLTESANNYFIEHGYNVSYGARPMRRLLQTEIENILAEKLISKELIENSTVTIDSDSKKIIVNIEKLLEINAKEKITIEDKNLID